MTYKDYIDLIEQFLTGTTLGGVPYLAYSEVCLTDEIELTVESVYPAAYLTPLPYDMNDTQIFYTVRIYIAGGVSDKTKRYETFSDINSFVNNLIMNIEESSMIGRIVYPISLNPILIWDGMIDGFYFDLKLMLGAGICM